MSVAKQEKVGFTVLAFANAQAHTGEMNDARIPKPSEEMAVEITKDLMVTVGWHGQLLNATVREFDWSP